MSLFIEKILKETRKRIKFQVTFQNIQRSFIIKTIKINLTDKDYSVSIL